MSVTTLSLIESLLLHDRPAAWWGLDTADPLVDDSGNGFTLAAVGTPSNSASLHTRGDTGASGSRDFNGTTGGYFTLGTIYDPPEGPPPFHGASSATVTSATGVVVSPGGVAEGDLMLFVALHPTAAATVTTAPSGWTIVSTPLNAGTHALVVYKKTAVEADTVPQEYRIVWNSSAALVTAMLVYRGLDPAVSGLIFDSARQVTASATFHSTTTETYPAGSRQLVIWTRGAATTLSPDPGGATVRLTAANGNQEVQVLDYEQEFAGSGFKTATTTVATTIGAFLITFGSPPKVVNDALDAISETITLRGLVNLDTVSGTDTLIRKHQSWGADINAGVLRFLYRDGGGTDRTITGPTLTTATTYRWWIVDDGTNINFYLNGTKTTSARTGVAGYTQNLNRVSISHYYDGAATSNFLDGRQDEVAVAAAPFSQAMVMAHEIAATQGVFGDFMQANKSGHFPRGKLELALDSRPTARCHVFTDVTADVRSGDGLNVQRGRNFELDRVQAGTMSFVLDNRERIYDDVLPRRVVRFRAQVQVDGPVYPIFFGYTDAPRFNRPAKGKDSTISFQATDAFKALSQAKVIEVLVRPSEYPGERLAAVLADVSGLQQILDEGLHLIIGDDLQGVNRLEHCQAVAETDGGAFFADALGRLVSQDNQYRTLNEQAVRTSYGWSGTSAIFPVYDMSLVEVDESRLYAAAAITPASGNVQRDENEEATLDYYATKEVTTLHASDADALAMAHHIVNAYSTPLPRIKSLVLQPAAHTAYAAMWTTVLGHDFSHRVATVEKPIGGAEVEREHFIEGVSHSLSGSDWKVTFSLSPTEFEGRYFKIGTSRIDGTDGIGW